MHPTATVQRVPYTSGSTDVHGNPADGWGAPLPVAVIGWGPTGSDETGAENRDEVTRAVDLYAPVGTEAAPHDRWVLDGDVFEQIGYPQDFGHGPYGWAPGVVIALRRVEG